MNMKEIEENGSKGFWMSRVPNNTKSEFKEFAIEEYEDDYGMAFKHVWEEYKTNSVLEILAAKILKLEEIVEEHFKVDEKKEVVEDTSKEQTITTLSGKKIKKGEK